MNIKVKISWDNPQLNIDKTFIFHSWEGSETDYKDLISVVKQAIIEEIDSGKVSGYNSFFKRKLAISYIKGLSEKALINKMAKSWNAKHPDKTLPMGDISFANFVRSAQFLGLVEMWED
jgi:hypothetical protein